MYIHTYIGLAIHRADRRALRGSSFEGGGGHALEARTAVGGHRLPTLIVRIDAFTQAILPHIVRMYAFPQAILPRIVRMYAFPQSVWQCIVRMYAFPQSVWQCIVRMYAFPQSDLDDFRSEWTDS